MGWNENSGEYDAQHIALVRAPTNAEGAGSNKSAFVDQVNGPGRLQCPVGREYRTTERYVNEGLIDRFEDTVRV